MLSERIRNIIVGLTMLGAVVALMIGIFLLGRFPRLHATRPYDVTIVTTHAGGLMAGNKVEFNGVTVGTVNSVRLSGDMRTVEISASVDSSVSIPANAVASISKPQIGNPVVSLGLPEAPSTHPSTVPALVAAPAVLAKDGSARLYAAPADTGVIPKRVLDKLEAFLEPRTLADFEKEDPSTRVANLSILIQRVDHVAKGVDAMVGDPKTQEQFRQIIANLEESSRTLKGVMQDAKVTVAKVNTTVDEFGHAARTINTTADKVGGAATQASATLETTQLQVVRVSDRLAEVLKGLEETTNKISKGEGTAGRLVNDPRLYEGLVDLSKSLKSTTDDLNVLVRKWKEEGVNLKLK